MKEQRKVQAGGILRTALDVTWRTPEHVLDAARSYFGGQIPLDPASAPDNPTRALRFCAESRRSDGSLFERRSDGSLFEHAEELAQAQDGLLIAWDAPTWVNPPYGRALRLWVEKITVEAARGAEVIALLPANRYESAYLQEALALARCVCLPRGRLKFISSLDGKPVAGNPYASMIVGWGVDVPRFAVAFSPLGLVLRIGAP